MNENTVPIPQTEPFLRCSDLREDQLRSACGHPTPISRPVGRAINREIRDQKLIARLRALARAEYAGLLDPDVLRTFLPDLLRESLRSVPVPRRSL